MNHTNASRLRCVFVAAAIREMSIDMKELGLSGRETSELLGMANTTFNTFMSQNSPTTRHHKNTINLIKAGMFWSPNTKDALEKVANYGVLLRHGQVAAQFRIAAGPTLGPDQTLSQNLEECRTRSRLDARRVDQKK